jgi:hypothetical protein
LGQNLENRSFLILQCTRTNITLHPLVHRGAAESHTLLALPLAPSQIRGLNAGLNATRTLSSWPRTRVDGYLKRGDCFVSNTCQPLVMRIIHLPAPRHHRSRRSRSRPLTCLSPLQLRDSPRSLARCAPHRSHPPHPGFLSSILLLYTNLTKSGRVAFTAVTLIMLSAAILPKAWVFANATYSSPLDNFKVKFYMYRRKVWHIPGHSLHVLFLTP